MGLKSSKLAIAGLFCLTLMMAFGCSPGGRQRGSVYWDELDQLYDRAQQQFYKNHFEAALDLFKTYVRKSKQTHEYDLRLMWVIDQAGRIYLFHRRDPDAAFNFFTSVLTNPQLSEAQEDDLHEWIGAVQDWRTIGDFPSTTTEPDMLYYLGESFYQAGLKKTSFTADKPGNADFSIAESYLVPFIVHYDHDERIGEALFMMGEIRRRLWNDRNYWSENFYFKEVIRRFPHSSLAQKAYQALEKDVRFGYSGSGGDNTPDSVLNMLNTYKSLAQDNTW